MALPGCPADHGEGIDTANCRQERGTWGASSFLWRDSSSGHPCTWHRRHVTHTKRLQDRHKRAQEPAPPGPTHWTGSNKAPHAGQVAGSQLSTTSPVWQGLGRGHLAISGDIFDCHNWEAAPGRDRGCCQAPLMHRTAPLQAVWPCVHSTKGEKPCWVVPLE